MRLILILAQKGGPERVSVHLWDPDLRKRTGRVPTGNDFLPETSGAGAGLEWKEIRRTTISPLRWYLQ